MKKSKVIKKERGKLLTILLILPFIASIHSFLTYSSTYATLKGILYLLLTLVWLLSSYLLLQWRRDGIYLSIIIRVVWALVLMQVISNFTTTIYTLTLSLGSLILVLVLDILLYWSIFRKLRYFN